MELETRLRELGTKELTLRAAMVEIQRELKEVCDERTRVKRAMNGVRFTGSGGEAVRFREYPGFGLAREVFSDIDLKWHHISWVK